MSEVSGRARTYGNWRRPQSAGLGRLGLIGTTVLMGGVIVMILTEAVLGLLPALVLMGLLVVFLVTLMVRDRHGKTGLQRIAVRAGWWRTRASGAHLYRSGPLGYAPWGTFQLPGLAAPSCLSEARDSYDRPFALLHVPATGHYTVVFAAHPDGASLVDQEQVDSWVAGWGEWLASLGEEPGVVAASVTIETAPDTGARLRSEVGAQIDPNAPAVARAVLGEVVQSYPVGSASISAWVALTFTATVRGAARKPREMARELGAQLPGLTSRLQSSGAGAVRPISAQRLCEVVRTAYEPAAARLIDETYAAGRVPRLEWSDAGPSAAEASWQRYRHDGALSVSWAMSGAPRGEVQSSVLLKLLAPHRGIARKRVTLLYRIMDSGVAAALVEADVRNADFRVASAQRPTARMLREQRAAHATAEEEARGAGLVDFGMVVTATVLEEDALPDAEAAIDNLAATARITLRRAYGSQDSAFAAGLPLGLVLPAHLKVPEQVRAAL
ncbi:MAG: SCO6880 family protein [Solirubrobacteraceae bacterium]